MRSEILPPSAAGASVERVLALYPPEYRWGRIEPLGAAGGFSGARFWRITADHGPFCLRRWPPEHPSPDRLRFIHAVVRHAARAGFDRIPVPVRTERGDTFLPVADWHWQLEPWMPGRPMSAQCAAPDEIRAAMSTLAEFHLATASYRPGRHDHVPAPGIVRRLDQIEALLAGRADRWQDRLVTAGWAEARAAAAEILRIFPLAGPALAERLRADARLHGPIQPCLRDIRSDHVLFVDRQVTGLIDCGAMQIESVAADVARLVGSLGNGDQASWHNALRAYEAMRPLAEPEKRLVATFDASHWLLAGMNWVEWIFIDRRRFEDHRAVQDRLTKIVDRLTPRDGVRL